MVCTVDDIICKFINYYYISININIANYKLSICVVLSGMFDKCFCVKLSLKLV